MRDRLWYHYWNTIKILIRNFNVCNIRFYFLFEFVHQNPYMIMITRVCVDSWFIRMISKPSSILSLKRHPDPTPLLNLHSYTILPFWYVRFLWRMNFSFDINQIESSFSPCIFSRIFLENCSGGRWYSGILRGSIMTECNCRNIDDRQL